MLKLVSLVKSFHKKHRKTILIILLSSLFWFLTAHGLALTNKYSFHDDIFLFHSGTTYTSGRWFLGFLSYLTQVFFLGNISLPLFNGLVGFCFLFGSILTITIMLRLTKPLILFCISGIMCVFPVICGMLGYNFTFYYYMISLFLATLSVFFASKNHISCFFIGSVLGSCSIGIYQAFLPYLLCLLLIEFLIFLYDNKFILNASNVIKLALARMLFCLCLISLYLTINQITLRILHLSLSNYNGMSDVKHTGFSVYLSRIKLAYSAFVIPLDLCNNNLNSMFPSNIRFFYYITIVLLLFLMFTFVRKMLGFNSIVSGFVIAGFLLFPLCANFIYLMADISVIHNLTLYAQCLVFVFLLVLIDRLLVPQNSLYFIVIIPTLLINILYVKYDNAFYLKAELEQQRSIEYFTRLATRIQSTSGYTDSLPLVFINTPGENDASLSSIYGLSEYRMYPYYGAKELVNTYSWETFFEIWCGYHANVLHTDEFDRIPEVINMPSYPDDGSIQIINNTLVVKF